MSFQSFLNIFKINQITETFLLPYLGFFKFYCSIKWTNAAHIHVQQVFLFTKMIVLMSFCVQNYVCNNEY